MASAGRDHLTGEIDPDTPRSYGACTQEQSRGGRHALLPGRGTGYVTGFLRMLLE